MASRAAGGWKRDRSSRSTSGSGKTATSATGPAASPSAAISEEKERLLKVTEEALAKGLARARTGAHLHDVSAAVQEYVEAAGFSVVRDLVGHGIGRNLHEDPAVPNFGTAGTGLVLKEGMALAVEPMVNAGTYRVTVDADGWTVRTADGRPSAHFEHTIIVRAERPEILTR